MPHSITHPSRCCPPATYTCTALPCLALPRDRLLHCTARLIQSHTQSVPAPVPVSVSLICVSFLPLCLCLIGTKIRTATGTCVPQKWSVRSTGPASIHRDRKICAQHTCHASQPPLPQITHSLTASPEKRHSPLAHQLPCPAAHVSKKMAHASCSLSLSVSVLEPKL